MRARRLTTILPEMLLAEAIQTTHVNRVAGLSGDRTALVTTHPYRAPHHTISDVGRIGGAGADAGGSPVLCCPGQGCEGLSVPLAPSSAAAP
jgi:magnesium chelatase family protein